ncbi:Sister chromatid cohesion protein PDS5-like protein A [Frankliniella fusca]|uniref:Sister chromatid cohesion protein PDS5-like protein A n=1 Tax=Frankliniella fusca TaxID=407009 RepID=A0AAE1LBB4_9NEOP|nr:Sister chromatid cohesion protein PDS5-like protein A [Frankliniella fusca]
MPSLEEKLDLLKNQIDSFREWIHQQVDLDESQMQTVMSVEELLNSLVDYPRAALEWSYGAILLMHLRQEDITTSPLPKIILTKFVENIHLLENEEKSATIERIWKYISQRDWLSQFLIPQPEKDLSLLTKLARKCFACLPTAKAASPTVREVFAACILSLIPSPIDTILNLLFKELVEPSNSLSKRAVQDVLKTCGWKISDSIRNLLNPIFHEPDVSTYKSLEYVYKVVFELESIDKCLVVGVINNTELCLDSGREDHEAGLEFLCCLFGSKLTGGPDYYSTLWNRFLSHCRDIIMCQSQLLILGKHTSSILGQPSAHKDWCSLLTFFFEHVMHPAVERSFVSGMVDALIQNCSEDIDPLMELFKKLLTTYSVYERRGEIREELILKLAKAYKEIARVAVMQPLLKHHERCAQLLSCFHGTLCNLFHPRNARWNLLRKIFVKYLVPFDFPSELRMKMLLYLWINLQGKWDVFQELFRRVNRSRDRVKNILYIMKDVRTFELNKHLIFKQKCELDFYLSNKKQFHYVKGKFGKALAASPKLRLVLTNLVAENVPCENARKLARAARHYLLPNDNDESSEIVESLLYYLTEYTVDGSAFMHLLDLVNSCIEGDEIASSMNLNRLHVARTALHLLNEILALLPHLGYDSVILDQIVGWAKSRHSCLSMLSIRCLKSIAYTKTLDSWNHGYVVEILVPLWEYIGKHGSRGQVKVAIECIEKHASLLTYRVQLLEQVLDVISSQLAEASKLSENFERGVSALGYFSSVTLPCVLKRKVEKLCILHLVQLVSGSSDLETMSPSSNSSSNNSWTHWEELSKNIRIMVQAIRSVGRCMRYCGSPPNVKCVLTIMQRIICSPKECVKINIRDVDSDHLKYEAACAILSILETEANHHFLSKQLLIDLSYMITHSREEVRVGFAKKICQGLSPHKILANIRGRKRGNLPTCMLGILALLGSHWWSCSSEARDLAEFLLQGVFASRQHDRMRKMSFTKVTYEQLYEENPHLIFENIMVIALPILAEHKDFQISEDKTKFEENLDPLKKMAICLDFLRAMLCHPGTLGGQVKREYMISLVKFARNSIDLPSSDSLKLKYSLLFDLLPIVLKRYKHSEMLGEVVTPPVMLPPPFFGDFGEHFPDSDQTSLPPDMQRSIDKNLHSSYVREAELELSEDEEDSSFETTGMVENSAPINYLERGSQRNSSFGSPDSFREDLRYAYHSTPTSSNRNARKRRHE